MLRYTVLRILIFFGCFLVLWLLGWRSQDDLVPLVLVSALASMLISFFALKGFRQQYSDEISAKLSQRAAKRAGRANDERTEDAEDEAGSGSGESGTHDTRGQARATHPTPDEGDFR